MTTYPIPTAAGCRTRRGVWLLMDADERNEWATWFERHGVDPHTLHPVLSVVADDTRRMVLYAAAVVRDGRVVVASRMVQLEAPALPFPDPS